jgi:hypothetical protein
MLQAVRQDLHEGYRGRCASLKRPPLDRLALPAGSSTSLLARRHVILPPQGIDEQADDLVQAKAAAQGVLPAPSPGARIQLPLAQAGIKLDAPLLDAQRQMTEYQREEDECPICLSTRYLKPNLRLLVSRTCYHIMCESCIDRNFVRAIMRELRYVPLTRPGTVVWPRTVSDVLDHDPQGVFRTAALRRSRRREGGHHPSRDCVLVRPFGHRPTPLTVARGSFNKRQEDFASLLEYNNYLEEVEDISALDPVQGLCPPTHDA